MRKLVVAVLMFGAVCAHAADRGEKVRALMEAQGLLATFEQQLQLGRERANASAKQMLDQILSGLAPPPESEQKFRDAVEEFIREVQPPWSSTEVVDTWSKLYGAEFSDEELDQLVAYYRSPLAQKEVTVSRMALAKFGAQLQERFKPVMERATSKYIERLKAIVVECNCRR